MVVYASATDDKMTVSSTDYDIDTMESPMIKASSDDGDIQLDCNKQRLASQAYISWTRDWPIVRKSYLARTRARFCRISERENENDVTSRSRSNVVWCGVEQWPIDRRECWDTSPHRRDLIKIIVAHAHFRSCPEAYHSRIPREAPQRAVHPGGVSQPVYLEGIPMPTSGYATYATQRMLMKHALSIREAADD